MGFSKRAVAALLAAFCLGGSPVSAAGAGAAAGVTTVYSARLAKAAFASQYGTVWKFIEPAYRKQVKESLWRHCAGAFGAQTRGFKIRRISVFRSRQLPSRLPLLGTVALVDVTLQVLYTLPGEKTLQAAALSAYWVKSHGTWYAVWLPSQYSAYKAGKCSPASLY